MWDAGGGPSGLAEKHCVSTLHQEQQTDHLVLAVGERSGQRGSAASDAVRHWHLQVTARRLR